MHSVDVWKREALLITPQQGLAYTENDAPLRVEKA